ncbi:MAG TPA: hydrogenase maturation protease [Solirubrobacteraceae bacterium]|nr:hydrogenase maturation protease [Solirubrobacteraceae bacterium]
MSAARGHWEELERPGPDTVVVDGVEIRRGSRVRLRPGPRGDAFDLALAGRSAVVEAIEQDMEGALLLAVTVDDDPGRDLGERRQPGHRFFFSAHEVEPLPGMPMPVAQAPNVLVAGIGNVFLGDDGFGVAVADRLSRRELAPNVRVADFGIRGLDLAYALADYDALVLVDAVPRGGTPGTLYVIEPDVEAEGIAPEAHGMDPAKVLALARELGDVPSRVLIVGCEPRSTPRWEDEDVVAELSEPVRASIDEAVRLVESLVSQLVSEQTATRR